MKSFGQQGMSQNELDAFLKTPERFEPDSTLYASVATLRRDGTPFVVPLGFLYDDGYLWFTITPTRGGTLRMRRDSRVAVTIYNWAFPPVFVIVQGIAEEYPDPDNKISLRIHHRYPKDHTGNEKEFDRIWLSPGRVLWRVTITDIVGVDNSKFESAITENAIMPYEMNAQQ